MRCAQCGIAVRGLAWHETVLSLCQHCYAKLFSDFIGLAYLKGDSRGTSAEQGSICTLSELDKNISAATFFPFEDEFCLPWEIEAAAADDEAAETDDAEETDGSKHVMFEGSLEVHPLCTIHEYVAFV